MLIKNVGDVDRFRNACGEKYGGQRDRTYALRIG